MESEMESVKKVEEISNCTEVRVRKISKTQKGLVKRNKELAKTIKKMKKVAMKKKAELKKSQ